MTSTSDPPVHAARGRADQDERARILAAARRLMRTRPFDELSGAEIAMAAGVSRTRLYRYFGTRRDLHLAVVEDMLSAPVVRVRPGAGDTTVRDRVSAGVAGWMELVSRDPQVVITATGAGGPGHDLRLDSLLEDARYRAVNAVADIVGLGELADSRPEVRALLRAYSGLVEAAGREWLQGGCLDDGQLKVLLEEALLALVERVLPRVLEAGTPTRRGDSGAEDLNDDTCPPDIAPRQGSLAPAAAKARRAGQT
ncbi:MAG TPA: TetR/AcrR family transcriptional regulator [Thermomonospora sp.]|nr:TetR/AcrR family transcriptional regulator [Thermomonospora sp.]